MTVRARSSGEWHPLALLHAAVVMFPWARLKRDLAVLEGRIAGAAFNCRTNGEAFAARGLSQLPPLRDRLRCTAPANIKLFHVFVRLRLGPSQAAALVFSMIFPISFLAMCRLVFESAPESVP